MDRRQFSAALGLAALGMHGATARAQDSRPGVIVVGFAPGGSVDVASRLIASAMSAALKRTYVVENRSGAAGRLAPEFVRRAQPDGATLMIVPHGPMTLFPHLYSNLRFDPARDFTPIARLVSYDYALIAGNDIAISNGAELRKWAGAAGAKANFGSPGAGSVPHFVGMALARALGIKLTHVPYRGAAPALTDVMGGQLALAVAPTADALQLSKQGKLKIIGTSGVARSPVSPDIPAFREIGIPFELPGWFGLYGPAGMPAAMQDTLNRAAAQALSDAAVSASLRRMGLVAAPSTPAALQQMQLAELQTWKPVVQSSGFRPED